VGGRSIIALPSTAKAGTISRIVPTLTDGAGVVTTRAEVDTIVTEYGIAELKGRTVRERALALISVAHPDFRADLLAAAKARHYVTLEQIEWPEGQRPYPVELISDARFGDLDIHFRPLRPSDERLLREFFYTHSAETVYYRYHSRLKSLQPQQIQQFCTIDYDQQMALAGFVTEGEAERMVAVGRYFVDPPPATSAEVAFTVHDALQGRGIGRYLLGRITAIARERSIDSFIAYVLPTNVRMLNVFQHAGLAMDSRLEKGVYTVTLRLA